MPAELGMKWLDKADIFSFLFWTAFHTESCFWLNAWILADFEKTNCPYSGTHQLKTEQIVGPCLYLHTLTYSTCVHAWVCVRLPMLSVSACVSARLSQCVSASQWIVHDPVCIMPVNISKRVQSSIIASTVRMEYIYNLRPTLCTTQQHGSVQGISLSFLTKEMCFSCSAQLQTDVSFYTQIIYRHINNVLPVTPVLLYAMHALHNSLNKKNWTQINEDFVSYIFFPCHV